MRVQCLHSACFDEVLASPSFHHAHNAVVFDNGCNGPTAPCTSCSVLQSLNVV